MQFDNHNESKHIKSKGLRMTSWSLLSPAEVWSLVTTTTKWCSIRWPSWRTRSAARFSSVSRPFRRCFPPFFTCFHMFSGVFALESCSGECIVVAEGHVFVEVMRSRACMW